MHHASDGTFHVKQRNGKIIARYPAGQESLADTHVRRLQSGYAKQEKALRDAAPELLALVIQYRDDLRYPPSLESVGRRLDAINAALAKLEQSNG